MAKERTLSIIKPDATRRNLTGAINAKIEGAGLRIIAQKRAKWKKKDAETFYKVHKERPFYKDLVKFMTSVEEAAKWRLPRDVQARLIEQPEWLAKAKKYGVVR